MEYYRVFLMNELKKKNIEQKNPDIKNCLWIYIYKAKKRAKLIYVRGGEGVKINFEFRSNLAWFKTPLCL